MCRNILLIKGVLALVGEFNRDLGDGGPIITIIIYSDMALNCLWNRW